MKSHLEKEKNFISAVVYMQNCEADITEFLNQLSHELYANFQVYELILVDDASKDRTLTKINGFSPEGNCNISVVKMAYYHGKEKAMRAGVDLSIGDFVYEFDSVSINYEPSLIFDVYKKALEGYDMVAASKKGSAKSSSKFFYKVLEKSSGQGIKLQSETFRIVSRRMINRALKSSNQVFYRKAIYHYSGLDTAIIEYVPVNSQKINDALSVSQQTGLAMDVLISHSDIGIRIAGVVSTLFLIFAILTSAYTVYTYFTLENIQPGWATTMFFLSVSFAGVFFVLFIVTKYLVNILKEVRNQPMYVYKGIEKIKK